MKRITLYSSARRPQPVRHAAMSPPEVVGETAQAVGPAPTRTQRFIQRFERPLLLVMGAVIAAAAILFSDGRSGSGQRITQKDIDAAVLHTLENATLPSPYAKAYDNVRHAVVRVRGLGDDDKDEESKNVGTGVVIVENGTILTNFHVVAGAKKVKVVFADGLESDAKIIGMTPEQDLAVLRATTIPDDLKAATLGSTANLVPGDRVVAVGFPFGIGPSASAGVVSGLNREFRSPQGKRMLTNLIQFDAAANPGNSGGPLVNSDGEVIGIVTAILNPSDRVFIGIGFAVPIESAGGAVGIPPF